MRIAHISVPWNSVPPKNYGGTEAMLYNLVKAQLRQGHEVTLFAPGDSKVDCELVSFLPRCLVEEGVPWEAHLSAYYHHRKAVDYIRAHQFDIVHSHLATTTEMYLFPLTAALGMPHVMTLHSPFPFDRWKLWTGNADEYYLNWIRAVPLVCISDSARRKIKVPLCIAGVVHHGIDPDVFRHEVRPPEAHFAWLGRFVPEKGAHLAIEAARRAGVPLILAGVVDRNVQVGIDYFESMIRPHLDERGISYVGPVDTQQKIRLLGQSRALLNPIEWDEPFGMVMIEALSTGCPVITFPRGAAPEIVSHGQNGFLVEDVAAMVGGIRQIDRINRGSVRADFEARFSSSVMARNYNRVYERVIATRM